MTVQWQVSQALGHFRGGFSTKIHLKTDFDGYPIAFDLTGGEKGDAPHFPILLGLGPDVDPRAAIGDKGYASKANRQAARARGIIPVIPHKTNEKDKSGFFAKALYGGRARIEHAVGKLKRFKRVALRCEKPNETSQLSSQSPLHSSWSNPSTPPNNSTKAGRRFRTVINARVPPEARKAASALVAETKVDIVSGQEAIRPLVLRSMFWRSLYTAPSAWIEHLPFAFWLVEAHKPRVFVELGSHYGVSYFGFCQAVDRLGLDTRCYAIDTWKGDEHAGSYDEEVFRAVKAHNEVNYSGFSRLIRSTFDDALRNFNDKSIDLLHIDGLHTFEAVLHDFTSWRPKLSSRAVVVLHDTNVRERDFGVYRLLEQLRTNHPSFEFVHGHGLGVVGIGNEQSELLSRLYSADRDPAARQSLLNVFSGLGRACADSYQREALENRAATMRAELDTARKQLAEYKASLDSHIADLATRIQEFEEERSQFDTATEAAARDRMQLDERIKVAMEAMGELKSELAAAHAEGLEASLRLASEAAATSEARERLKEVTGRVSALDVQMRRERAQAAAEIAAVRKELTEARAKIADLETVRIAAEAAEAERSKELAMAQPPATS